MRKVMQTGNIDQLCRFGASSGALLAPVAAAGARTCCLRAQEPADCRRPAGQGARAARRCMDDPDVRDWLARSASSTAPHHRSGARPHLAAMADMTAPAMAVRQHILASLAAVPDGPARAGARPGGALYAEIADRACWSHAPAGRRCSWAWASLLERLYWRATTRLPPAADRDAAGHGARRGCDAVGRRLAFGLGWIASFALGSLGAFLLFDWPPLLHGLIARVLLVVVVVWLTRCCSGSSWRRARSASASCRCSTASAAHWYLLADAGRRLVHRRRS